MPTLSLIVGAVAYEARHQQTATVSHLAFRISFWLSVVYLALVLTVFLGQPFSGMTPLGLMQVSNLFLGPIQGLLGLALGVFFVSRQTSNP